MTESRQRVSQDAADVYKWLLLEVAEQGTGRRPSKIQMAMGWYGEDEPRVGHAIRELVDLNLVTLEDPVGIPGMGPWVCPKVCTGE